MRNTILLVLLLLPVQGFAGFLTGDKLLESCQAYINATDITRGHECVGYITGIADVHETFVAWGGVMVAVMPREGYWCLTEGTETGRLVQVVTKWLQENPGHLHNEASSLVATALKATFPCR